MSTDVFAVRAERVINAVFGGKHHVFSLKFEDDWLCTFLINENLATYDYAGLTKLVVACHDECVRGEILNGGPRRLRINLTDRARKHRNPDACAHPTMDQHLKQIRKGGSYQPLFDQLRDETEPPSGAQGGEGGR